MTTAAERLGAERRLIFENVANGVPIQQLMSVFRRSEKEVMDDVKFVAKKIAEYRFLRRLPPLGCSTISEISLNRRPLLETVRKLGDLYLSTSLEIPNIHVGSLADPHVVREAEGRSRGAVRMVQ